jgi:hypothetical protein
MLVSSESSYRSCLLTVPIHTVSHRCEVSVLTKGKRIVQTSHFDKLMVNSIRLKKSFVRKFFCKFFRRTMVLHFPTKLTEEEEALQVFVS